MIWLMYYNMIGPIFWSCLKKRKVYFVVTVGSALPLGRSGTGKNICFICYCIDYDQRMLTSSDLIIMQFCIMCYWGHTYTVFHSLLDHLNSLFPENDCIKSHFSRINDMAWNRFKRVSLKAQNDRITRSSCDKFLSTDIYEKRALMSDHMAPFFR